MEETCPVLYARHRALSEAAEDAFLTLLQGGIHTPNSASVPVREAFEAAAIAQTELFAEFWQEWDHKTARKSLRERCMWWPETVKKRA
jgi:hypothetical protein